MELDSYQYQIGEKYYKGDTKKLIENTLCPPDIMAE